MYLSVWVPYWAASPWRASAHLIPLSIPVLRGCQVLVLLEAFGSLKNVSPTGLPQLQSRGLYINTVRGDRMGL